MSAWLALLLCTLATVRLTRLVIEDTIADKPRTWLAVHLPTWCVQLLICQWCAGFWIAGLSVAFATSIGALPTSWKTLPLEWLAVAAAAGLLGSSIFVAPDEPAH